MHGQLAAKVVEVVYNSKHEKLTHMQKMVGWRVVVFPLSNKTVIQGHVLLVILLFKCLVGCLAESLKYCV